MTAITSCASIYSRAWYGDEERELIFPDGWEVHTLAPQAYPALSERQMNKAFSNPIGTRRLADIARDRRNAAIVIDDLSRPTPAATVIPYVLRELIEAGMPQNEIRFVVGGGSHRPLTAEEIAKKVGPDIVAQYEVVCHGFLDGDCKGYGNLSDGMPVYINRVVAEADFKLALGGIYPHSAVGFGGGAKLIIPGVAGAATMWHFHGCHPGRGHAIIDGRDGVLDTRDVAEEAARLIGLDAVVNTVLNYRREIAGLFVGDFIHAHRAGARFALKAYGTEIPDDLRAEADLVVTNCYPLDSDPLQTGKALWMRKYFDRAYTVAINPATDGQFYHGLMHQLDYDRYLKQRHAEAEMNLPVPELNGPGSMLLQSEHFSVNEFVKRHPNDVLFRDWPTLINMLLEKLPEHATVAVFPFGGIQVLSPLTSADSP